ncbi:MAG TPA: PPA1309 family protein [Nocardioidaceae bacterium]|nr:PPA1309 family protein [Nocardioidaceae bacterium]
MTEWLEVPAIDPALRDAVREIEAHASQEGWDRPARLFALVDTAELVAREPALAKAMGLDAESSGLTAVEQDEIAESALEETLLGIEWPDEVAGCAAVVERFVLPPSVEEQIPDTDAEARAFAAAHPERQEVRIVAAAIRTGATYCALRLKSHDDDFAVLEAPDLVPTLIELLLSTLHPHD